MENGTISSSHKRKNNLVTVPYILPCYDVLHTFSKDYLVEELTEVLKERGALA